MSTVGVSWHSKSVDEDLFFCTNMQCRVVTFVPTKAGRNICPFCHINGALVRREITGLGTAHPLAKTERSSEDTSQDDNDRHGSVSDEESRIRKP